MSESIQDFISIRQLQLTDLHFILDSFISCISKYTESIVKGYTYNYTHPYLEKMMLYVLNKPNYSIYLASHKDDTDNIIGYIIADTKTNHIFFQYTKYSYRKLGIQKHMLLPLVIDPAVEITVQFPTKEMLKLQKAGRIQIQNKFLEELLV